MQPSKPLLRKRLFALFVDYLLILAWIACLGAVSLATYRLLDGYPDYLGILGPVGTQAVFFVLLTLPVGLYLYLTESGPRHATLGKRKAGLAVASADGRTPSKKQILVRTVVKLLPWEIAHTFIWQLQYSFYREGYDATPATWILIGLNSASILAIIYVLLVALRADGRGPHDIAARTQVVHR